VIISFYAPWMLYASKFIFDFAKLLLIIFLNNTFWEQSAKSEERGEKVKRRK